MKHMRLNSCLLSILLFIASVVFSVSVFAHPGRTDSSGGHYNRSTGEYHYHHGKPEHDHEDFDGDGDLDCPYTYKSSPTPTPRPTVSIKTTAKPTATPSPSPTPKPTIRSTISQLPKWVKWVIGIQFVVILFLNLRVRWLKSED